MSLQFFDYHKNQESLCWLPHNIHIEVIAKGVEVVCECHLIVTERAIQKCEIKKCSVHLFDDVENKFNEKHAQIRNGQVALEQSTKTIKQYQKGKRYSSETKKKLITKNKRQE